MGQDDKVGQGPDAGEGGAVSVFERLQEHDKKNEVRILWSEVAVIAIIAFAMTIYLIVA